MKTIIDKACYERGCACYDDRVDKDGVEVVAQQWVGLTDEEFQMIYDMGRTPAGMMEMVEAKLKEKNA